MIRVLIYNIVLLMLMLVSCKKTYVVNDITEVTLPKVVLVGSNIDTILAGTSVTIQYRIDTISDDMYLEVSNSLSSTLVLPEITTNNTLSFTIGQPFTNKTGVLVCNLICNKTNIASKAIYIKPNKKTKYLENYLGPSYISAIPTDYAMLVSIPFDEFGNPNQNSLKINRLWRGNLTEAKPKPLDLVNYSIISSTTQSGKLFLKVSDSLVTSKRLDLTIRPSFAQDFTIDYQQNNSLADDKELTRFTTSQIKDKYGNIIANGSLVRFKVKDLNTSYFGLAKTINGVAVYDLVHPSRAKTITIQAFIEGFAKSNTIDLNYEANDF